MKRPAKLDWRAIWREFDKWYDAHCADFPEWPDQKRVIQRLVNRHLSDQ